MFEALPIYARHPMLIWMLAKFWILGLGNLSKPIPCAQQKGSLMGLPIHNPVGLAAGIDRHGYLLKGVARAGYGFAEIGSVTSQTFTTCCANLKHFKSLNSSLKVGVNIRIEAGQADKVMIKELLNCVRKLLPLADYIVLNFSSFFSDKSSACDLDRLKQLISVACLERDIQQKNNNRWVPFAVKLPISQRLSENQSNILKFSQQMGLSGVLAVTSADQDNNSVCQLLRSVKNIIGDMDLISVGGITSSNQLVERINAGAKVVQVFSLVLQQGIFTPSYLLQNYPNSFEEY